MAREIDAELWNRTFPKGAKELAKIYTVDAQCFPPNMQGVAGNKNIQAFWEESAKEGYAESTAQTAELIECGNSYVCATGTYTVRYQGAKFEGKYMTLWKKEGGDWKIHRQIWNRNSD